MATQAALIVHDEQEPAAVSMFERLARDPNVDVDKLERLMAMQERVMAINRKAAFDGAFALLQKAIPQIDEKGKVIVKGTLRSTYARLEDIHEVIKPILAEHGFAIRHRTEWPQDRKGIIRIVGILSHEQGHSEESCFEAPMDQSDFRSDIQSMCSTVSYGRRYTTLDLLNIATRNEDKDGQKRQPEPEKAPDGFDEWWSDMQAVADEGLPALEKAWSDANKEPKSKGFLAYAIKTRKDAIAALKAKAGAR